MNLPFTIAHYKITAKLGEGGMGAVYRATDTKLNREVAIKVLPDALANDPDYLARFTREAQVLASLNHPNIAIIHGVEDRALVMELVPGATLEEKIAARAIPLEEALGIAAQIADALEAAHEKGVIHRDLKPANVKVTPEGVVKVLDFGLAKAADAVPAAVTANSPTVTIRATQAGLIMGTPAYMAPEQARGQPVDKRADIWAFGIVLWEMLTGKRMFAGETVSDVLAAVLTKTPDLDRVPVQVRRLLAQCLEKDPKRRLRDIGDVWGLLEELPRATRPRNWGRIAATAVLALAIPATWVLKPKPEQPEQPLLQVEISAPEGATFGAVNRSQFALSPDGRRLVFLATGKDGKRMLWMRLLAADSAAALAGTENADAPFWSPDSRSVGFFASGGTLQKIDVGGGRPQVICIANGGSAARGTWNSEGVIVFAEIQKPLRRVLATGGTPTPVLALDVGRVETDQAAPYFLPDGQHFLYSSYGNETGIAFGSLDGKTHRFLFAQPGHPAASYVPSPAGGGWLMYNVGGQLLARPFDPSKAEFAGEAAIVAYPLPDGMSWSASANGLLSFRRIYAPQSQLTWFDRDGKRLGVAGDPGSLSAPRISPDQKTIVFSRGDGPNSDLAVFDVPLKTTNRLALEPGLKVNPIWSSDGSRIFYAARRQNDNVLVERPANGIGPERILKSSPISQFMPNGMSRDGHWLVVSELTGAGSRLILLSPVEGKSVPFPAQPNANRGFFSPDGRWMLYSSRQAGRFEVFVQSLPKEVGGSSDAGGTFLISSAGGLFAIWRGDEIFYLAPDAKMMAVPVESGVKFFRRGTPKQLFQTSLSAGAGNREYDVTPDGQRILINQPMADTGDSPITVIVNWPKVLQK